MLCSADFHSIFWPFADSPPVYPPGPRVSWQWAWTQFPIASAPVR
jgi:hypothetical protein